MRNNNYIFKYMNYVKIIGSGLLIWVIMFAFVSAFLGFYNQSDYFKVLVIVVSGVVSLLAAYYIIKPKNIAEALFCSAIWLVVAALLDYLITMKFNSGIFYSFFLWGGYFTMVIAPALSLKVK